jgi:putative transposase
MTGSIAPLTFGNYYHIYNRGNNRQNVFIQERNYGYFMDLWWMHTYPIAETYAICLLRNHFHAAVHIKREEDLKGLQVKEPSQYFSNLFNAYTRGVNIATQRTGALFERTFERIPVTNEAYFLRLVVYIHQNPQKHKFVDDFRDWGHSSFHELLADAPTRLQKTRLMELFGSRQDFIDIHREMQIYEDSEDLTGLTRDSVE